jgi:hypothetical protein
MQVKSEKCFHSDLSAYYFVEEAENVAVQTFLCSERLRYRVCYGKRLYGHVLCFDELNTPESFRGTILTSFLGLSDRPLPSAQRYGLSFMSIDPV